VRVDVQEWPLEIKNRPVEKFGDGKGSVTHSFAKDANEWGTRRLGHYCSLRYLRHFHAFCFRRMPSRTFR
jgi:hypothetical protein